MMKFKKQNAPKQNKYIVIKRMRIKLKKKIKNHMGEIKKYL
jgi:hypothetical protein